MWWMPLFPQPTASRCAKLAVSKFKLEETASMREATIVGVDVARTCSHAESFAAVSRITPS